MRKIIFFFLLLILSSCSLKPSLPSFYDDLREKGFNSRKFWGKVYLEGDLSQLFNLSQGGSYGTFYLNESFFLLTIKSPFGEEVYFQWEKETPPKLIIPAKAKVYLLKGEGVKIPDLPYYFLGLKEARKELKLKGIPIIYTFEVENMEGKIRSSLFFILWRIKEIHPLETLPPPIDITQFKEKSIKLPF